MAFTTCSNGTGENLRPKWELGRTATTTWQATRSEQCREQVSAVVAVVVEDATSTFETATTVEENVIKLESSGTSSDTVERLREYRGCLVLCLHMPCHIYVWPSQQICLVLSW